MTTTAVTLPWDAFLKREADKVLPERRQAYLDNMRQRIDGFRRTEWLNLKRQLKVEKGVALPDGLEPHWVEPGRAVWWQEQVTLSRVEVTKPDGTVQAERQPVSQGWAPTAPQRTNNAAHIAQLLRMGLRLRPPSETTGAGIEALQAALAPEGSGQTPAIEEQTYTCGRHPVGEFRFTTWKGYMRHCIHYGELPEGEPPQEVKDRMKTYKFYCVAHDTGFNNQRHATHHVKTCSRRMRRAQHISVEQMLVRRK